ncbi:MAG: YjbH domain-containing protein [Paracoccaceae bacterium]
MTRTLWVSALASCVAVTGNFAWSQNAPLDTQPYKAPAEQPSLNFYGLPGVIDTPSALAMPDGQLAVSVSHFAGQTRTSISAQFTPRLSATFRYIGLQDFNDFGFSTFRDRSFDLRYLILKEGKYLPAVTVGLQDLAGTGIYSGEYVVATKTFDQPLNLPGQIRLSGGLGWGRLGSSGAIGTLFGSARPAFVTNDTGGEPSTDQWFRGDVAPFAGIEWTINDRIGLKAEYSSDAYEPETSRGLFTRDSRLNLGVEYQYSDRLRLGAYYLYGSELGVSAQLQLNPNRALTPRTVSGARPIIERPSRATNPTDWTTDWAASSDAPATMRDALAPDLATDGLRIEALQVLPTSAELRFTNTRFENTSIAVGRAARAMARVLPASVETFRLTPMRNGLALSTITVRRTDLERLEFEPDAASALYASAQFEDAHPTLPQSVRPADLYPQLSWSYGPYVSPSYFDPDRPVRADAGLAARMHYRPAPGWLISGEVRARLAGNIEDGRESNSVLPRVRTDAALFAQAASTPIDNLFVSRQWKPGRSVYARVSAGYLESMFGGVSGEVLWKPANSRLALGAEINYARQRDFDQRFGFQDYDVVTGHISAYYELGRGYTAQVDVGRYLAGDKGATFTLSREFENGWKIGGFVTLTDVSSADFGEGSFDKGVTLTIPLGWFLGQPSRQKISTTIRPIQRDGGARLRVPGRLYEQVRKGHREDLAESWSRVWN